MDYKKIMPFLLGVLFLAGFLIVFGADSTAPYYVNASSFGYNATVPYTTIVFNGTCYDDTDIDSAELWHNISGTMALNQSIDATNATQFNFEPITIPKGKWYSWRINCSDSAGNTNTSKNFAIAVDDDAPTVILESPANQEWVTNGSAYFVANVTDEYGLFLDSCTLYHDINGTFLANQTNSSVTQSLLTYYQAEYSNTTYPDSYTWNVKCNNTFGYSSFASANYTMYVDTEPFRTGNVSIINPLNETHSTDYTPIIYWDTNVSDDNFLHYKLRAYYLNGSLYAEYNSSSGQSATKAEFNQILLGDTWYYLRVIAEDRAGHTLESEVNMSYRTESFCHDLVAGYNVCANERDGYLTAGQIVNETGASYVYRWNRPYHNWSTHVAGSSVNRDMTFYNGEAIFLYVSSNSTWSNRTWTTNYTQPDFNFSNVSIGGTASASFWNIWCNLNRTADITLDGFERSLNASGFAGKYNQTGDGNFTYFSLYENDAGSNSHYIPYIWGVDYNNNTIIKTHQCVWVAYDGAISSMYNQTESVFEVGA